MLHNIPQFRHRIEVRKYKGSIRVTYSGCILWSRANFLFLNPLSLFFQSLTLFLIFRELFLSYLLSLCIYLFLFYLRFFKSFVFFLQLLLFQAFFFLLTPLFLFFPLLFVFYLVPFSLLCLGKVLGFLCLLPFLFVFCFFFGPLFILHSLKLSLSVEKLFLLYGFLCLDQAFFFKHSSIEFPLLSPLFIQTLD